MLSGRVSSRDGCLSQPCTVFSLMLVWVGILSGWVPSPGPVPTHTSGGYAVQSGVVLGWVPQSPCTVPFFSCASMGRSAVRPGAVPGTGAYTYLWLTGGPACNTTRITLLRQVIKVIE